MDPRLLAKALLQQGELSLAELWLYYWRNGGDAEEMEFDAFINGIEVLAPLDLDVLACALDEARQDTGGHW